MSMANRLAMALAMSGASTRPTGHTSSRQLRHVRPNVAAMFKNRVACGRKQRVFTSLVCLKLFAVVASNIGSTMFQRERELTSWRHESRGKKDANAWRQVNARMGGGAWVPFKGCVNCSCEVLWCPDVDFDAAK